MTTFFTYWTQVRKLLFLIALLGFYFMPIYLIYNMIDLNGMVELKVISQNLEFFLRNSLWLNFIYGLIGCEETLLNGFIIYSYTLITILLSIYVFALLHLIDQLVIL